MGTPPKIMMMGQIQKKCKIIFGNTYFSQKIVLKFPRKWNTLLRVIGSFVSSVEYGFSHNDHARRG